MINLNVSTMIYRPIKQVFNFMSAPENDFQWQCEILASARLSEGASTIGTLFRSIGHLMGRRVESTFEVTEYEPNRKYGFKSLSGPLQSFTTFTFHMVNGGTQVNLSTQANIVNLIEFSENVCEKKLKRQLKENLSMLKSIMEQG